METTAQFNNPGCKGCRFKDRNDLCGFMDLTGVSRLEVGAISGPDGRCSMYRKSPKANTNPSKYDTPKTLELYEQGLNDRQMASALGCSPFTIFNWRKRHDKPPNTNKGHGQRTGKLDNQETFSLYRAGLSDKDMAERLGCSRATVSTWRKRHQLLANGNPGRPKKDGKNENDSRRTPGAGPGDDDEHREQ